MKTLFVETLDELGDDERAALEQQLRTVAEAAGVRFILIPPNVFTSPSGETNRVWIFREEESEGDGDDKRTTKRELAFPTKADLYDFLASPTFQGLEEEAAGAEG